MPRRKLVHKAAATAAAAPPPNNTPAWLHRLHAKAGVFFPTHLHIDDFLYGRQQQPSPHQPLPLLPASPSHCINPVVLKESPPKAANPRQHQQPSGNHLSPNPRSNNSPQLQPQSQFSTMISDVFAFVVPSSALPDAPPREVFRRQYHLRPRAKPIHTPSPPCKGNDISKAKKRRRSKGDGDSDGECSNMIDVTVIDTSTDGWKAAKVLIHSGDAWKVCEKEPLGVSEQDDAVDKGKRRGLVSRMLRDKETKQEKDATSSGNILACTGDVVEKTDDPILTLKRS